MCLDDSNHARLGSTIESQPDPTSPLIKKLLLASAYFYIAFNFFKYALYLPFTSDGAGTFGRAVDYPKHWYAARAILEGESTYLGEHLWLGFNYPQWTAIMTFWLGWFDLQTGEAVWKLMQVAFVIGSWWIAAKWMKPALVDLRTDRSAFGAVKIGIAAHWILFCAFVVVAYSPTLGTSVYQGNIEPTNTILSMGMVALLLSRRDRAAGFVWGMFCLVKMMPVLLLLPVLLWKRWKFLQGWFVCMAIYLVTLIVLGRVHHEWFFVTEVMSEIGFFWRDISISIPSALIRWFAPEEWFDAKAIYDRFNMIAIVILGLVFVGVMLKSKSREEAFLRPLEPALLFLPLLTPLLEGHHVAWVLPVWFLHLGRWMRGELSDWLALLYTLGWAGLCLDLFYINQAGSISEHMKFMSTFWIVWLVVFSSVETCFLTGKKTDEATAL